MATEKDTKQREIKFRAKGVDGRWWYGEDKPTKEYRHANLATFFMNLYAGLLDLKTLGQYIDRKDNSDKAIYDGDIVQQGDNFPSVVEWNRADEKIEGTGWCLHEYYPRHGRDADVYDRYHTTSSFTDGLDVIGNIHDNPEILEKS